MTGRKGATERRTIYLDYQASTPLDARVLEEMLPWWRKPGNAHSVSHAAGRAAQDAIERARQQVAQLVGGVPEGVIFTSGATEATNIALRGLLGGGDVAVTSAIEHACVLETLCDLVKDGCRHVMVGVGGSGVVNPDDVESALYGAPALVTVMAVNNEVGTVQPFADIGRLCSAVGVPFHTDAAQAAGRVKIDVARDTIDLVSLSSHKLYGPQGFGALYCRPSLRRRLRPVTTGGGQELGLRSGTVPTALAVGFGAACALAAEEMEAEEARLMGLRGLFLERLSAKAGAFQVNGSLDDRVAGNLNLSFPGVEAEALLARLPDLCLSTGSACSSGAQAPSHVLTAMGLTEDEASSAVRMSFGRGTEAADLARAADRMAEEVAAIKCAGRPAADRPGPLRRAGRAQASARTRGVWP